MIHSPIKGTRFCDKRGGYIPERSFQDGTRFGPGIALIITGDDLEIPMSFTRVNVIENDLKPAAFLRIPNQMAVPEFKRAQKDGLKIGR